MRLLLLDTCGDTGSLALAEHGEVLRERILPARGASAQLVRSIREELEALAWPLRSLDGVTVVNGPGSFTGVRVGLAAAKGLCEVAGLRLITVSRLEVLLRAGGAEGVAVLDAGRGEFYVRSASGADASRDSDASREELLDREQLFEIAAGPGDQPIRRILVAEEKLIAGLEPLRPQWVVLSAAQALPLAMERLQVEPENVAEADANYVRQARALYAAGGSAPSRERP